MQKISKSGSALAFVVIIAAALMIMAAVLFTMADSSIAQADTGIKSRETYLSAKSGVEFIKSRIDGTMTDAQSSLSSQIGLKDDDPDHHVSISPSVFYGYGDLENGFTMNAAITESSTEYKNARIKIKYSVSHHIDFELTDYETGAGIYTDEVTITASSTGKSAKKSSFTDALEKGIRLPYDYHDSKTAYYSGVPEDPDEPDDSDVIPDTNIPVNGEWPASENIPGSGGASISSGTTFYYQGNAYYVVMYTEWIPAGAHPSQFYESIVLINPGPAKQIDGWAGYPLSYNKTLPDFNAWLQTIGQGPNIQRGDKVIYNGIYYILRDEASTVSWVDVPPGYPWFMIPNQS